MTLKDSSSWKLGPPERPAPRVAAARSWGFLASESIQRPVPVQPKVPKPLW